MKKLFLLLAFSSLTIYSMEEENGTELQKVSMVEQKEGDSTIESDNSSLIILTQQEPCNAEKKSKSCCWSLTKRILIGSLLASQGIGLATDIVGMQQSQQVSALVSPVIAYNEYHAPHNPNCTYESWMGYLDPLPGYMRDEGCTQGQNQQISCVFETCPGGQEYINRYTTMFASQITAIAARSLTILGILGNILGCGWECGHGFTFK